MQDPLDVATDSGGDRSLAVAASSSSVTSFRDLVTLAKPRITFMVVFTAAGGLYLSRRMPGVQALSASTVLSTLIGCALIVSGANALNMYLERDIDRRMDRTKNRPLPAGRMSPKVALWFGMGLSAVAIPVLAIGANALTALLAIVANLLYVLAYTPLKQHSFYALHVGAVPGAIPPLLGWTAATGRIDAGGMVLFAIMFLWQIPHFNAIALFRKADYARAGLHVMPNTQGELATRHSIVRWTFALVATSLLLVPLGIASRAYLVVATVLGALFFVWGCYGLRQGTGRAWAKSLFALSIVYLTIVFAALAISP
ncbi:MAG: Heme synthase, protoheme farnesyltransferase [Labilithrix sp.]|nr:Heme synthase, protoheme farnesyltransferase [Labilithrix sp.]